MELTANMVQTVGPNNNVLFTDTTIPGNCSILHRPGSGLVTLRGLTQQAKARFRVTFGANVAIPPEVEVLPINFAIAINGEPVATTTMTVTPDTEDTYFNISRTLFLEVPATCCSQVSVENISTTPINVRNASLIVERVA